MARRAKAKRGWKKIGAVGAGAAGLAAAAYFVLRRRQGTGEGVSDADAAESSRGNGFKDVTADSVRSARVRETAS